MAKVPSEVAASSNSPSALTSTDAAMPLGGEAQAKGWMKTSGPRASDHGVQGWPLGPQVAGKSFPEAEEAEEASRMLNGRTVRAIGRAGSVRRS